MESKFRTELKTTVSEIDDSVYILDQELVYDSEILGKTIIVPSGFNTDFASVPRFPIAYLFYGGRSHREAVIHDYLYRIDSDPVVGCMIANKIFLEAMKARGKSLGVAYPMFWGVVLGGWTKFHKLKVTDKLT